jgi:uncharacterized protein YkwD
MSSVSSRRSKTWRRDGARGVVAGLVLVVPTAFAHAEGRPTPDGFPSDAERSLLILTNAARQDPLAWCQLCGNVCGGDLRAAPPSDYDARLGRASRFHARHMHDVPCFQHDSCCVLEKRLGRVQCASAPEAGCARCSGSTCSGTDPWARMALFDYGQGSGENIAAGRGSAMDTLCQWMGSSGHRANILAPANVALGTGAHAGEACFNRYWVHNFGRQAPPSVSRPIVTGGFVDRFFFAAVYHDPDGGPPQSARVAVGGACHDLTLTWGSGESGTWVHEPAPGTASGECVPYWFVFTDAAGERHTHPGSGALVLGGDACAPFVEARPASACDGCADGDSELCYDGAVGTEGEGACTAGVRICEGGRFGACEGQVVPDEEGVCRAGGLAGCGCGATGVGEAAGMGEGAAQGLIGFGLAVIWALCGRRKRREVAR